MILIEEKYKAVPRNYKGIVRLKPTIARFRPYYHAYVKLEEGYHYTGNPDHSIKVIFYRTYEDLKNRENMMLGWPVDVREYLLYPVSIKKNNYW